MPPPTSRHSEESDELSDTTATADQLKKLVQRFCEARDWDQYHDAKNLAIGVVTEAAELVDHFRFKSDREVEEMLRSPRDRKQVADELADTLFFILRLAQRYDIDLASALKEKLEANALKYPVEKARGSNKKYTDL